MLLSPQKIKFFKSFARRGKESLNSTPLKFILGDYALRALEVSNLSGKQLEATRKTLRRALRKDAKIWVSAFPNVPMTKKPQEVRMGRGKGNVKQ
jgi:large subunit ribosomal protein L16